MSGAFIDDDKLLITVPIYALAYILEHCNLDDYYAYGESWRSEDGKKAVGILEKLVEKRWQEIEEIPCE